VEVDIDELVSTHMNLLADVTYREGTLKHKECIICYADFKEGERVKRIVSCGHYFHEECIKSWLSKKQSCPTCRGLIMKYPDHRQAPEQPYEDMRNVYPMGVFGDPNPSAPSEREENRGAEPQMLFQMMSSENNNSSNSNEGRQQQREYGEVEEEEGEVKKKKEEA